MYKIEKRDGYLLVRFEEDFDYNVIQTIIHHVTSVKEYPDTNDIWLVDNYRADIRLGELESMVREFHCHCPRDASRSKTAIVVKPGLTQAIIELWVSAAKKHVSFDMRIFNSKEDARLWIETSDAQFA